MIDPKKMAEAANIPFSGDAELDFESTAVIDNRADLPPPPEEEVWTVSSSGSFKIVKSGSDKSKLMVPGIIDQDADHIYFVPLSTVWGYDLTTPFAEGVTMENVCKSYGPVGKNFPMLTEMELPEGIQKPDHFVMHSTEINPKTNKFPVFDIRVVGFSVKGETYDEASNSIINPDASIPAAKRKTLMEGYTRGSQEGQCSTCELKAFRNNSDPKEKAPLCGTVLYIAGFVTDENGKFLSDEIVLAQIKRKWADDARKMMPDASILPKGQTNIEPLPSYAGKIYKLTKGGYMNNTLILDPTSVRSLFQPGLQKLTPTLWKTLVEGVESAKTALAKIKAYSPKKVA